VRIRTGAVLGHRIRASSLTLSHGYMSRIGERCCSDQRQSRGDSRTSAGGKISHRTENLRPVPPGGLPVAELAGPSGRTPPLEGDQLTRRLEERGGSSGARAYVLTVRVGLAASSLRPCAPCIYGGVGGFTLAGIAQALPRRQAIGG
jgi:hypothetical protein